MAELGSGSIARDRKAGDGLRGYKVSNCEKISYKPAAKGKV
jgi:hypothetical protein